MSSHPTKPMGLRSAVGRGRQAMVLASVLGVASLAGLAPGSIAAPSSSAPTSPTSPAPVRLVGVATGQGRTAASQVLTDGRVALLVGTGANVAPVAGLPSLPTRALAYTGTFSYPRVHVGTDRAGRAIATYPRCQERSGAFTCDLWALDLETGREARLAGTRRAGRNEYEAVSENGSLLFATGAGLMFRPAGGRERRIAREGGWDLALRGHRAAQVLSDGVKEQGEEPCRNSTLVLRRLTGSSRPQVRARDCIYSGDGSQDGPFGMSRGWVSPQFVGDRLQWVRLGEAGTQLFRGSLPTGRVEQASLGRGVAAFAATGASSGLTVPRAVDDEISAPLPAGPTLAVREGIAWRARTATLLLPVFEVDPAALL